VIQAAPSSSVTPLLYGDSMSDGILPNPQTHPQVAPPTACTIVNRPPAAPDPVAALQPTSATSKNATLSDHLPSLSNDTPLHENLSNEDLMHTPTTTTMHFY